MTVSAESATAAGLILIFMTALGGGALAFLLVYWLWLRRFSRRMSDLQDTVFSLASTFSRGRKDDDEEEEDETPSVYEAPSQPQGQAQAQTESPREVQGYRMLVEGRDIEIIPAEGGEEIRIEETPDRPLTARERDRIIAYLRNEGFLP